MFATKPLPARGVKRSLQSLAIRWRLVVLTTWRASFPPERWACTVYTAASTRMARTSASSSGLYLPTTSTAVVALSSVSRIDSVLWLQAQMVVRVLTSVWRAGADPDRIDAMMQCQLFLSADRQRLPVARRPYPGGGDETAHITQRRQITGRRVCPASSGGRTSCRGHRPPERRVPRHAQPTTGCAA